MKAHPHPYFPRISNGMSPVFWKGTELATTNRKCFFGLAL
ncbi:hypothetical protein EV13_2974 [Prochlorococcus sp. MIT 0702]|nr:hypothetical protein EV12_2919 [Prochlorococcus sp. MIT 0701]KGG26193.1 hypothetical protein EV13_2974 [Prochlorococcus sp. MIT 0702]KGG33014.1 hypothetical protein EV14_1855 [Prochlorococcus sp. MIT 0703]